MSLWGEKGLCRPLLPVTPTDIHESDAVSSPVVQSPSGSAVVSSRFAGVEPSGARLEGGAGGGEPQSQANKTARVSPSLRDASDNEPLSLLASGEAWVRSSM
jgi:hypothetical protein